MKPCRVPVRTVSRSDPPDFIDFSPCDRRPRPTPLRMSPCAHAHQALNARLAALDLTDVGNAKRLIARHGYDLRYSHAEQKWYM